MVEHAQHQVWARALWVVLDLAAVGGIAVEPLCRGLSFDAETARTMKRVPWDDFVLVVERLEAAVGGEGAARALARAHYYSGVPELRALAGLVVSPKTLLKFLFEVVDPIVYPMVEWSFHDLGPRDVRVGARLRDGVRPCGALYRGTSGALEGLPTTLGLPPAVVTCKENGFDATWDIKLPKSKTLSEKTRSLSLGALSRALQSLVIGSRQDGTTLTQALFAHGSDREERLELATQRWQLSRRQAEVLASLVEGKTNKEIGALLGCAEATVEQHVTQILERSSSGSRAVLIARFWTEL